MAFATYILSSFSFKATSVSSKSIANIDETASLNTHTADSSRAVNLVTVDNQGVSVSIETTDQNVAANSNFRTGEAGTLIMKGKLRTAGDGLSTEITITVANAVCGGASTSLPNQGEGSLTISFEGYDPNADDATAASLITYA